ncbi:MAG: hypothetical protein HY056_04160 [Proteobacteria bacterium]|nr:hypothetical protein [Pseudomonadota bacterium]
MLGLIHSGLIDMGGQFIDQPRPCPKTLHHFALAAPEQFPASRFPLFGIMR